MKFRPRSFPHPVLGSGDDVPNAQFQVIFEVRPEKTFYYLDSQFQVSSPKLIELINTKRAAYVMHVECGTTLYRKKFQYFSDKNTECIVADELRETVEVNHFITATIDLPNYSLQEMHTDYEGAAFNIRKGDILAINVPGQRFFVEKDYDSLQGIGSFIQIDPSSSQEGPMDVDLSQPDKIRIVISKTDYENYLLFREKTEMIPMLHSSIILPGLMSAITSLKDTPQDEEGEDCRWRRILRERLSEMKDVSDDFLKAQRLLGNPLTRTLSALKTYAENPL